MTDNKPSILVIDDEQSIREAFSLILSRDFRVMTAASGEAALKKVIDEKVDLAFLDIRMPGMNGIETLKQMRHIDGDMNVIMVTAVNDIKNASEAIRHGARDYIVKPFDADAILKMAKNFSQKKAMQEEVKMIRSKLIEFSSPELIGQSKAVKEIERTIARISQKDLPVLIRGNNGTEKELAARIIHMNSKRAGGPFVILDIPARYAVLDIKRELFGWEKGGFVAAFSKKDGAFEKASSGTLIMNNIDLLDQDLQADLEKALSSGQFSRIGSMSDIRIDARLIFTSTTDIKDLASKGLFSMRLFELISEAYIEIPELKNRTSDIPVLIEHFMDKYSKSFNKEVSLSPEALDMMAGYSWPGNTIELENTVKQMVLTAAQKEITPEDLPLDILLRTGADTSEQTSFQNIKSDFEGKYVSGILKKVDHDKIKAANILGVGPKVLDSMMESLDLK